MFGVWFVRFSDFGKLSADDMSWLGDDGSGYTTYVDPRTGEEKSRPAVDGEDYMFKIFEKNPDKYLTVYFTIGQDFQNFRDLYDRFAQLINNVRRFTKKGIFDPEYHKIVMVVVERQGKICSCLFNQ